MVTVQMTIAQIARLLANGMYKLPETTEIKFMYSMQDNEVYGVKLTQLFNERKGVIAFGCYTDDSMRVCTRACGISQILFDEFMHHLAEAIQVQLEVWMLTESNGKFINEKQLLYVITD